MTITLNPRPPGVNRSKTAIPARPASASSSAQRPPIITARPPLSSTPARHANTSIPKQPVLVPTVTLVSATAASHHAGAVTLVNIPPHHKCSLLPGVSSRIFHLPCPGNRSISSRYSSSVLSQKKPLSTLAAPATATTGIPIFPFKRHIHHSMALQRYICV